MARESRLSFGRFLLFAAVFYAAATACLLSVTPLALALSACCILVVVGLGMAMFTRSTPGRSLEGPVRYLAVALLVMIVAEAVSHGPALLSKPKRRASLVYDRPNAELPKRVRPTRGQIALVADYEAKRTNCIPVYLVNDTKQAVELRAQAGDVYLKLEVRDRDGKWVRAQPHAHNWCGTSRLFGEAIRPGHFLKIDGYQPKTGDVTTLRFSLYNQRIALSSRPGKGLVAKTDIDLASRDTMAVGTGAFDFVRRVALGETKLTNEMDHVTDLQGFAVSTLGSGKFDQARSVDVLTQVLRLFPGRSNEVAAAMYRLRHSRAATNTSEQAAH